MIKWGELSCLTVPLRAGPYSVGLMVITETEFEARYSDDDLELVRTLGEQAAVAIRNARLFEDLEKRSDELAVQARRAALVNELSRELSSMREVDAVLETTARRFVELFSVTASCDIYRLDGDSLVDVMSFAGDTRCHEWDGKRLPLSEWHADRRVIETHEPLVVASPDDPGLGRAQREAMLEWGEQCVLVVPMILKGAVTGTVKLGDRRQGRTFSPDEVATARAMAGVAALAIENAELYREQSERARRLASLIEAGKAITSRLVFDDVLATVARTAAEALGCPECVIYDYDAGADTLTPLVLHSEHDYGHENTGTPFPLSDWPSDRELLRSRQTLIETVSDPCLPEDVRDSMEDWGEKTCLSVPLYFGDQPLGMLVLIETECERQFSADEIALANGVAEQAAIALHNARLVSGLRHRTDEATLLNDVARASAASLDVADIAGGTVAQLCRVTPFEQGALLLEREPGLPVDVVYTTQRHSQLAGIRLDALDPALVARLEHERAALLRLPDELPLPGREIVGLRSAAIVGLFEEQRLIGLLVLGSASERTFSAADRSLFAGVGAQLSLAVRNARLYDNVRRLHLGNLRALSSALTAKDYYTLGHTTRVAVYAVLLAKELGLPDKTVQQVEEIAYLHDIGKIAVSDRVLLKPGALSDEEWELMRQHPSVSAEIIEPLLEAPLVAAVRHHHERYDGRGYPDGLAGSDIPELARLLCVVDCYDAMSSRRVYRRALTFRECVAELQRCRGTQFDPGMVDAMLRMLRRLARQQRRAAAAAAAAAALVPARDHALVSESADERCREYRAIQAILSTVRASHPDVQRLVTEVAIDDRRRAVIVDAETRPELRIPLGDTGFSDDLELDAFAGRRQSATIVTVDTRGTWIASAAPVRDEHGAVVALVSAGSSPLGVDRLAGVSTDVSETFAGLAHSAALRVSRAEIDAITDSLTGLYNHRHLQERLAVEVALANETGEPLALLFADLDRFKQFNDRRGHTEGDEALRELARIVSGSIRSSDVAARYGGDQFAVVLHGGGLDVAVDVAERIRTRVEQARLMGDRRRLTVSVGIAVLGDGLSGKDELLQRADEALAAAKLGGRNRCVCSAAAPAAVALAGR
jgi:diguanylate cyclase (GGDEF)-like protein